MTISESGNGTPPEGERAERGDDAPEALAPGWWADHGISPEVRDGRPYGYWWKGQTDPVEEAYAPLNRHQRSYMAGLAKQQPGIIIFRHPPPGMGLSWVCPEIRPDEPVQTGPPHWHHHPTDPPAGDLVYPSGRSAGKPFPETAIMSAAAMEKHIARKKASDDHKGVNCEVPHEHVPKAKYTFPPAPRKNSPWTHDHKVGVTKTRGSRTWRTKPLADDPERLANHLIARHGGVDVVGEHEHNKRVKDKDEPLARRLDVHPMAWEKIQAAEWVFFSIEGCIKADAILSAGEAVFSVPSVTLWAAPELREFAARHLQGKRVVIVPDADWFKNRLVIAQALFCRSFLDSCGVEAHLAAAPRSGLDKDPKIKGIDDFLGIGGGRIDDMEVLDWEPPDIEVIHGWILSRMPKLRSQYSRLLRAVKTAWALSLHAREEGVLGYDLDEKGEPKPEPSVTLSSLATMIGSNRRSVERTIRDLDEIGAIIVEHGGLDTQEGNWRSASYFDPAWGWVDPPTIRIHPDLVAQAVPAQTLGALRGTPKRKMAKALPRADRDALDTVARMWHETFGIPVAEIARRLRRSRRATYDAIQRADSPPIPGGIRGEVELDEDGLPVRKELWLRTGKGDENSLRLAMVEPLPPPPDVKFAHIEEAPPDGDADDA